MSLRRRHFLAISGTALGLGTTAVGPATAQTATVGMKTEGGDQFFDPIGLFVEPGTTVTFENASGSHNTVSYDGRIPAEAETWNTEVGATVERTFQEPGTYDYYCQPHKTLGMVGRIVVGEPGGPAEGSMPPDGDVPDSGTIVSQGSVGYEAFASGGGGGDTPRNRLIGAGLLGGMGVLAAIVYTFGNSEGESTRVGSSEWKEREGVR